MNLNMMKMIPGDHGQQVQVPMEGAPGAHGLVPRGQDGEQQVGQLWLPEPALVL